MSADYEVISMVNSAADKRRQAEENRELGEVHQKRMARQYEENAVRREGLRTRIVTFALMECGGEAALGGAALRRWSTGRSPRSWPCPLRWCALSWRASG